MVRLTDRFGEVRMAGVGSRAALRQAEVGQEASS